MSILLGITRLSVPVVCKILGISLLLGISSTSHAQQGPLRVDVITPEHTQSNQQIMLTGSVEAKQHAELAPLEAGRVNAIKVEVGDVVEVGKPLIELDSTLASLEVQGAQASMNAAKVNFNEAERLYKELLQLSKQQLVAQTLIAERSALLANAKAQLARTQATLSLQQELLERHTLVAPFQGVITQRSVDVGEWVSQQTSVLTLVAQNELRLVVSIPQQYFQRLANQGSVPVTILPDAPGAASFSAKLSRIVPVSDTLTRTFLAQIDLPSAAGLVAGMSARAQISLPDTQTTSIALPRSAIKQHPDGGSSVFIVENGKAKRIITGFTNLVDGRVSIDNVSIGAPYIVSGVELLKDGAAVVINTMPSNNL